MYRITQLNSSAQVGGGETHLLLLARFLHGQEFHFDFILPEEGAFCNELNQAGLTYHIVPMTSKFQFRSRRVIEKVLSDNRTDLAHCHGARANWYGRVSARRAGVRALFCTVHNSLKDYPYPNWRKRLYLLAEKRTRHLVSQWIAVSEAIKEDLVTYYGLPPGQISVVPNGVDPESLRITRASSQMRRELGISPTAFVLLQAARMTAQKGHTFLLEAVARLQVRISNLHCLLAGDGPLRESLEKQAQKLNIFGRVTFLGFRSDIANLIGASDLYVLPSLSEGMPVGLLEAMALGCPVVASGVNGVPEVVRDRADGILVPPGDVENLCRAIEELEKNSEVRRQLGESGAARVRESFWADRMARQVATLYRAHLGGSDSAPAALQL